jgi:hypothetical protein
VPREARDPAAVGAPPPGSDGEFWSVWSEEQGREAAAAGLPPRGEGDVPRAASGATTGLRSERRPERSSRPEREGRSERSRRTPESVEVVPAVGEPRSSFDGPKEGESRLFLNLGRKDDATLDEVVSLFADLGVNLGPGDIEVMNTHSYVNVPADEAERVCNDLTGRDRDGRKLSCEPARPRRR